MLKRCTNQKALRSAKSLVRDDDAWDDATWLLKFLTPFLAALRRLEGKFSDIGAAFAELALLRERIREFKRKAESESAALPTKVDWDGVISTFDSVVRPDIHPWMHAAYYLHPWRLKCPLTLDQETCFADTEASHYGHVMKTIQDLAPSSCTPAAILKEYTRYKDRDSPLLQEGSMLMLGITKHTPPLVLWDHLGEEFPILAAVARRLFTVPASSSGIERTWSQYRHIQSKSRSRLSTQKTDQLVFCFAQLNAWGPERKQKEERDESTADDPETESSDSSASEESDTGESDEGEDDAPDLEPAGRGHDEARSDGDDEEETAAAPRAKRGRLTVENGRIGIERAENGEKFEEDTDERAATQESKRRRRSREKAQNEGDEDDNTQATEAVTATTRRRRTTEKVRKKGDGDSDDDEESEDKDGADDTAAASEAKRRRRNIDSMRDDSDGHQDNTDKAEAVTATELPRRSPDNGRRASRLRRKNTMYDSN